MAFFKPRPKTSQQKAQRAQIGIAARIIGCGYLVYIVVQMFKIAPEDESMSMNVKIAIAVVFIAAAAVLAVITLLEFYRNFRGGFYKAETYSDDVNPALLESDGEGGGEGSGEGSEAAAAESSDHPELPGADVSDDDNEDDEDDEDEDDDEYDEDEYDEDED